MSHAREGEIKSLQYLESIKRKLWVEELQMYTEANKVEGTLIKALVRMNGIYAFVGLLVYWIKEKVTCNHFKVFLMLTLLIVIFGIGEAIFCRVYHRFRAPQRKVQKHDARESFICNAVLESEAKWQQQFASRHHVSFLELTDELEELLPVDDRINHLKQRSNMQRSMKLLFWTMLSFFNLFLASSLSIGFFGLCTFCPA